MERKGLRDLENLDADDLLRRLESSEPRRKKRRLQIEEEPDEGDALNGLDEDDEDSSGGSVGVTEDPREADDIEGSDAEIDESSSNDEQEDVQEELSMASRTTARVGKEDVSRISLPTKSRIEDKQRPSETTTLASASSFLELGASKALVASLTGMSIRTPTEVQAACIPPLLAGASQYYPSDCFI